MLHGYGNQKFLRTSYEEKRNRALYDRTKFTHEELVDLEVTETGQGIAKIKYPTFRWNWDHSKKIQLED